MLHRSNRPRLMFVYIDSLDQGKKLGFIQWPHPRRAKPFQKVRQKACGPWRGFYFSACQVGGSKWWAKCKPPNDPKPDFQWLLFGYTQPRIAMPAAIYRSAPGPGPESAPRSAFSAILGTCLGVPWKVLFECFLGVFWALKMPKGTQKHSLGHSKAGAQNCSKRTPWGTFRPGPRSTPVNGGRDRKPRTPRTEVCGAKCVSWQVSPLLDLELAPRSFPTTAWGGVLWGKFFYLQLELFCLQLSFFAYSALRPLLDAVSHCKQRNSNCKQKN